MKDILKGNEEDFAHIHKSFIVNRQMVAEIDNKSKSVKLIDGQEIPASVRGLKEIRELVGV